MRLVYFFGKAFEIRRYLGNCGGSATSVLLQIEKEWLVSGPAKSARDINNFRIPSDFSTNSRF